MIGRKEISKLFVRDLFLFAALAGTLAAEPSPVSVETIVANLVAADGVRNNQLAGYTGTRTYFVENTRFKTKAKMDVHVSVDPAGVKLFKVIQASGPGAIRKMVFQRMLDTEARASGKAIRQSTQLSPANYTFRLVEAQVHNGRQAYVLEVEPKTRNELLLRGRIWVDAEDYAVVRIEGSPAQNPSFWVKKTRFVHTYVKVGNFWLASSNHSESDVRIFGHSTTHIDYSDYRLAEPVELEAAR
jgi:hypothetical protein